MLPLLWRILLLVQYLNNFFPMLFALMQAWYNKKYQFIERCREEASINWVTDEVVREAVKNRCAKLGFDYEKTKERVEVAWTSL